MSTLPPPARARAAARWLLASGLAAALAACGSSDHRRSPDPGVNPHLVHQHALGAGEAVSPYQTVVLNLASRPNDHDGDAAGTSHHRLDYEITNAGRYRFCIPDDDAQLTGVELFGADGDLVRSWRKGEPCTAVPLAPGRYTLHVHLEAGESEPMVFLKPHETTVTAVATLPAAAPTFPDDIPDRQLMDLRVPSLTELLRRNASQALPPQGWGLTTTFPDGTVAIPALSQPEIERYGLLSMFVGSAVAAADRNGKGGLFSLARDPATGKVTVSQGQTPLVQSRQLCTDIWDLLGPEGLLTYDCDEFGWALVPLTPATTGHRGDLGFSAADGSRTFRLDDGGAPLSWVEATWEHIPQGSPVGWGVRTISRPDASPFTPVDLTVTLRYGTTSGLAVPAMLGNEVALFDKAFGASGFPGGTRYWIVDASQPDFSKLSFDDPTDRIRTVIAGRQVRAEVFERPSFQGASFYVSPPRDGELALTATDVALLGAGTVGSIRLEANTNDISVYDYEHHVMVAARTCIGCDLRGFDASAAGHVQSRYGFLTSANFTGSDLSNANFAFPDSDGGELELIDFSGVNLTGADFTNIRFESCKFARTDLTRARLDNAQFSLYWPTVSNLAFYEQCPKFEEIDLTRLSKVAGMTMDAYFTSRMLPPYDPRDWWENKRPRCKVSIARSKVSGSLFQDKHLWQFLDAKGADFSGQDLSGAVLAGVDLSNARFRGAKLRGTILVKANLSGADLTGADLTGADLSGATLAGVDLRSVAAKGDGGSLAKVGLRGLTFSAPNWSGLELPGAALSKGSYTNWDGQTFEFDPTSLVGAYMHDVVLKGADLSGAFLTEVSWFGDRATGADAIMEGTHFEWADLPGLDLKQAHLAGANFGGAVLIGADLSSTTSLDRSFDGTVFTRANLKGANLSGANLRGAQLSGAYVSTNATTQTATLERLVDPALAPNQYEYVLRDYQQTKGPASTDGVRNCPNRQVDDSGGCGPLTASNPFWQSAAPPLEPTNCKRETPLPGEHPDDTGKALHCTSERHRKTTDLR